MLCGCLKSHFSSALPALKFRAGCDDGASSDEEELVAMVEASLSKRGVEHSAPKAGPSSGASTAEMGAVDARNDDNDDYEDIAAGACFGFVHCCSELHSS